MVSSSEEVSVPAAPPNTPCYLGAKCRCDRLGTALVLHDVPIQDHTNLVPGKGDSRAKIKTYVQAFPQIAGGWSEGVPVRSLRNVPKHCYIGHLLSKSTSS